MVPRKQAGHMTCTRPQAERQILLAMRASSTHDPKLKWIVDRYPYSGSRGHLGGDKADPIYGLRVDGAETRRMRH